MNSKKTYNLVIVGLFVAICFITNYLSIPVASSRIHFGNVFCVIAGLLLGPLRGGIAAGFGAFIFDLTFPAYAAEAPITLVFKFMLAFVVGVIAYSGNREAKNKMFNIIAAIAGSFTYIVLYLSKSIVFDLFLYDTETETAIVNVIEKGIASSINAVLAVIVSMILYPIFRTALTKSGALQKLR